jgi:hypothetical protein
MKDTGAAVTSGRSAAVSLDNAANSASSVSTPWAEPTSTMTTNIGLNKKWNTSHLVSRVAVDAASAACAAVLVAPVIATIDK